MPLLASHAGIIVGSLNIATPRHPRLRAPPAERSTADALTVLISKSRRQPGEGKNGGSCLPSCARVFAWPFRSFACAVAFIGLDVPALHRVIWRGQMAYAFRASASRSISSFRGRSVNIPSPAKAQCFARPAATWSSSGVIASTATRRGARGMRILTAACAARGARQFAMRSDTTARARGSPAHDDHGVQGACGDSTGLAKPPRRPELYRARPIESPRADDSQREGARPVL